MKNTIYLLFFLSAFVFAQNNQDPKEYSIEQFYENTRIGGGRFSPDESKLLISSDESGIFNLYEIDISTGEKKAISSSENESYFAVDYVPGTQDILYSADKGGNEINHLYLLKPDGSSKDLTPGENEKAEFAGWSEDREFMYYLSNKRNPQFFDLYQMKIGTWEPEMLYENTEGYSVSISRIRENTWRFPNPSQPVRTSCFS
ncbi:DPP IV N-terminal domain-containing protein [Gramella sp. GC03-9]|uniref:DPP IV N-terminal domain-containing protein n=1 Tax=Christiangramia oceanisediminis TaxID=2920386 RepID=A0A9X2RE21_9FLAO|nr:DPP IV N-terminal domain-containing protein [Gramella oceanisediminis]MCP9201011.1 DPP IV N-terminal domain-containing protein [Gramella oceanisediminis]